jgi:hypothetical protein
MQKKPCRSSGRVSDGGMASFCDGREREQLLIEFLYKVSRILHIFGLLFG